MWKVARCTVLQNKKVICSLKHILGLEEAEMLNKVLIFTNGKEIVSTQQLAYICEDEENQFSIYFLRLPSTQKALPFLFFSLLISFSRQTAKTF